MDSIIKRQRIASLIFKERTIGLTKQESGELEEWRGTDSRNEAVYAHLQERVFDNDTAVYRQIDVLRGLERYRARFAPKKRVRLRKWRQVAAVTALLIGIAVTVLYYSDADETLPMATVQSTRDAVLVLDDGRRMNLSTDTHTTILAAEGVCASNNGSELRYPRQTGKRENFGFNELLLPKGGEYTVSMPDGTKVWVNSQSRLRYPVAFGDTGREVYLEGEAYFEVAKDESRPFRIRTKEGVTIEVLGTSFNVRSYTDEEETETVLESGSVRMAKDADTVVLSPGHRALFRPGQAIQVTEVETELHTAWRNGQYIFKDATVETILKQLARWYDLEVFYSDEAAKGVTFSGDVTKYETIDAFLKGMEISSELRFTRNGKTLVISSGK